MKKYPIVVKKTYDKETWEYHMKIIKGEKKKVRYPIVLKKMSDKETKEYYLKKLEALCLKSLNKDTFYSRPGYYFTPDWDEEELTKREKRWL